jgi:glycosyltransferase involved in cell wall biosynthesis
MGDSGTPIITLVIPTRERADTLRHTLRSAVEQDLREYEILVSDNQSQDDTRAVVSAVSDARIRYLRTDRRLSMCDNWEFALQQARGDYVIFIGDDDAVLPHGIDRLAGLIRQHGLSAYMWTTPIYTWPIDDLPAAITYLPPFTSVRRMDLERMARFVMAHGGWKYYELPGVYHCAVARTVLQKIGQKAGRVFRTTQPDLFTSMAVPAFAREAVHTGIPVTLHGRSAKSNGGSSTAKDGPAVLQRYIREFGDYPIHGSLYPNLPIYANLLVDAFMVARDCFPEFYGSTAFNFSAMWAFLYKLQLVTKGFVLGHRTEIRKYHPFSAIKFLGHALVQDIAILRRRFLTGVQSTGPFSQSMPDNVFDFARMLSEWRLGADPAQRPTSVMSPRG